MKKMIFCVVSLAFQLASICNGEVSKSAFFVDIDEHQEEGTNTGGNKVLFDKNFHHCSLAENCKYLELDETTKKFTEISKEDDISRNRTGKKVWKKVIPEEATHRSCKEAYEAGYRKSGVIKIRLEDGATMQVYCDMDTDGGGWTVILRRTASQTNFNRTWQESAQGFGNLEDNFWLGLDKIHLLTTRDDVKLRVDLQAMNGSRGVAEYTHFSTAARNENYTITLGSYTGDIGDSMPSTGTLFSAWDMDNDNNNLENCAAARGGPWWYQNCGKARLLSVYMTQTDLKHERLKWVTWGDNSMLIAFAEMKIRE